MRVTVSRVLSEMNCCARCVLRLLGERNISLYGNPEQVKGFNLTTNIHLVPRLSSMIVAKFSIGLVFPMLPTCSIRLPISFKLA